MKSFMWFAIGMLFTSTIAALSVASFEYARFNQQQVALHEAYELLNQNSLDTIRGNQ